MVTGHGLVWLAAYESHLMVMPLGRSKHATPILLWACTAESRVAERKKEMSINPVMYRWQLLKKLSLGCHLIFGVHSPALQTRLQILVAIQDPYFHWSKLSNEKQRQYGDVLQTVRLQLMQKVEIKLLPSILWLPEEMFTLCSLELVYLSAEQSF